LSRANAAAAEFELFQGKTARQYTDNSLVDNVFINVGCMVASDGVSADPSTFPFQCFGTPAPSRRFAFRKRPTHSAGPVSSNQLFRIVKPKPAHDFLSNSLMGMTLGAP